METTRRELLGTLAAAAALAGCAGDGGRGDQPGGTADGTATQTTAAAPAVRVRSDEELGDLLVGPEGMTLYMFEEDTNGAGASSCNDGCAGAWPPLTGGDGPTAGEGVTAELGSFERADGTRQVTAAGWPLYYFADDSDPGDTNGGGVDGVWWVLRPDGTQHTPETTTEDDDDGGVYDTTTEGDDGYGY